MNLKFVKRENDNKKPDYEWWDFVNASLNQYKDYFVSVKGDDDRHVLRLSYFGYSLYKQFNNLIHTDQMNELLTASEYHCPFNAYKHISIAPVAILTSTEQAREYVKAKNEGREPYYTDMACDPEWRRPDVITNVEEYTNDILTMALGPGFTDSCWPGDGYASQGIIGIDLENGDTLLFIIVQWYII